MLFRHNENGRKAILIIYVDIIIIGVDTEEIERLKRTLAIEFKVKNLGYM